MKKPLSVKGQQSESVDVFGVTSEVFMNDITKFGTVFFMDIDTKFDLYEEDMWLHHLLNKYSLSHFFVFKTTNGVHIISFDIRNNYVEYFELFREFKILFDVDYEFGHKWILRLSRKGNSHPPVFIGSVFNKNKLNALYSQAHMEIYKYFCNLPDFCENLLKSQKNIAFKSKFLRFVNYKTWNYT